MFAATVIFPVTKVNASEQSQRLDLIISVSRVIDLFLSYLPFAVWLSVTYHFFVANLDYSLVESINKFIIFCVSILCDTEFCENWKVVSSDF